MPYVTVQIGSVFNGEIVFEGEASHIPRIGETVVHKGKAFKVVAVVWSSDLAKPLVNVELAER